MTPIERRISYTVENCGLSNTELARKIGVERTTVSKWLKTGKISIENFAGLCIALNIDPRFFLFGDLQNDLLDSEQVDEFKELITKDMINELDKIIRSHETLLNELRKLRK
ncbi:helix-turn-helix domain-containing protein [Shewanella xiamenensis]|uniref:Helix-turn-helix domain-containing protein n=1 Tax=Shewanella xiamenensis TaxID=332186 RepID=A0ABT6UGR5_9GAMM|nr:helix-turn-helix domain-containing protein [Shewanella xiamenensis]MDI5833662.1 helix-turn-helix domain-containing protein [Shewanella xiamenensis]